MARAEDIVTAFANPLYEGTKWQSIRAFAHDVNQHTAGDPNYQLGMNISSNFVAG